MKRDLATSAVLQTASTSDNGLEEVTSWSDGSTYRVTILPASTSLIERAGLRDDVVTHQAIVPRGLSLSPQTHRFKVGTQIYRIVEVTDTPFKTVVALEKRDGQT